MPGGRLGGGRLTGGGLNGAARVFSVPPGAVFLDTLADALLDGRLVPGFSRADAPLGLAAATVYVPTRRSARALAAVLAAKLGEPAAFLPRIVPLGALDDADVLFDEGGIEDGLDPELPQAIGDIARRMILTRLVLAWSGAVRHAVVSVENGTRRHAEDEPLLVATSPADAWHLSGELARLIDELTIEDVAWSAMRDLGTEAHDRYWRITLDFLDIAVAHYPQILAGAGLVDRSMRQVKLIEAETARLAAGRYAGPIVVAGSTGSNKATARLIAAVSRLPRGAVVLPGLDQRLDEAGWAAVGSSGETDPAAGHPQHALHRLLGTIGIGREGVVEIGHVPPGRVARGIIVGEALRPAETTDRWRDLALDRAAALDGVSLIEAADEREEALAIAVALREALDGSGTAALVTPDRLIARRVREELMRWDVDIEDSSGEPLGQTRAGTLARLVLDCALRELAPLEVLAVLHHPDVRLARPRREVLAAAALLEGSALRGVLPPRPLHDLSKLLAHVRRARDDRRHVLPSDETLATLSALLEQFLDALAPLRRCGPGTPLPAWVDAHESVLATLLTAEDGRAAPIGPGYPVLSALFEELDGSADPAIALDCTGYAALFDRLAAEMPVRGPHRSHPRIKILGLLEARLLAVDRLILGGLDEAVWPPEVRTDPFLNRPMRAALGLSEPERRIGRTAHDFEMAMGQPEVIVSRARKRGGSPTVPSRFLQRLEAVAGPAWSACAGRGRRYVDLARALDRPAAVRPIARPAPRPDIELRPRALSVTRIETLRRDPYSLYAERILRLVPRDPLAAQVGARELGTAFHLAVAQHGRGAFDGTAPADAMLAQLSGALAGALEDPQFRAFSWPRVARWTGAYLGWHDARAGEVADLSIERKGAVAIRLADGSSFELRAEADRIERDAHGHLTIIDFKTGAMPSLREVKAGFAPQLTLEAAMAARGAFRDGDGETARDRVKAALYVKLGGGDAVEARTLHWKDDPTFDEVVASHWDELVALLNSFRRVETGYMARPFPKYARSFGPYDHLSRVKEWSANGGAGGDETVT